MKKKILLAITALMLMTSTTAFAQCTMKNTAVKNGEFLTYNLYYNWKFVWVKAGSATMTAVESVYKGKPAIRTSLTTRGNGTLDDFFILRDTLLSYSTTSLAPLYYRKGAREGNYYTVDEAFYSYPNGKCQVKLHRQKNSGEHVYDTKTFDECIFDMMNMFQRARNFNPTGWQKGHEVKFKLTEGIKILPGKLRYIGKTTVKGDNGKKYSCLQLSYIEIEKGKEKEIARFFVTDDDRHIPVRLDMNLKIGSAKAFVLSYK